MADNHTKLGKTKKIEHSLTPANNDIEFLTKQINHETAELGSAHPFAFFVRSDADEIIAGCNGSVIFGSIYTDQLWVHPDWRQRGLGRKLMDHVHDYGRKIGCQLATVATMSFQNGRKFYEKLGYKVDFERSGYVNNSSCLFLKMQLDKPIQLTAYNPDWPKMFEAESINIIQALGDNCIVVHHIGSTSVPGLAAKPKIDIIAVVKPFSSNRLLSKLATKEQLLGTCGTQNRSVLNAREDSSTGTTTQRPLEVEFGKKSNTQVWLPAHMLHIFEELGYNHRGEFNIPFKYMFTKRGSVNVNLHALEENHPEIELALLFRDYLRKNDNARNEYATLKDSILNDPSSSKKQDSMFPVYTLRKNDFILNVLKQNGFNRLRFVKCTHYAEMEAYHRIKEDQIFRPINIDYDLNHPSLTLDNHFHFVLYKGTEIVSIAHVEFLSHSEAALRALATDTPFQNQGFGTYTMNLLEKWISHQGRNVIKMHARLSAETFYRKLGYTEMPFDDSSISEDIINLGKILHALLSLYNTPNSLGSNS